MVSGDGEHHDATGATLDFYCRHGRTRSLRLHYDAKTEKRPLSKAEQNENCLQFTLSDFERLVLFAGQANSALKENGPSFGPES